MKKFYLFFLILGIAILFTGMSVAGLVINEVDADQTGTDSFEFIELYNTGPGSIDFSTANFQVVLFNGSSDSSYTVVDITSGVVSNGGFVLVGVQTTLDLYTADVEVLLSPATNAIQNGADGVGLYTGTPFTGSNEGVDLNTGNLVDGLVYDTNDADDPGLLAILASGDGVQVNEAGGTSGDSTLDSIQRYPNGTGALLSGGPFVVTPPTPAASNVPVELSQFSAD